MCFQGVDMRAPLSVEVVNICGEVCVLTAVQSVLHAHCRAMLLTIVRCVWGGGAALFSTDCCKGVDHN